MLLDLSRRIRDLKFGPVSSYLHFQFFTGYGEDIMDYNVQQKSQIRDRLRDRALSYSGASVLGGRQV